MTLDDNQLNDLRKTSMKDLFSYRKRLKSGELSKAVYMPTTEELHTSIE